MSGSVGLVIPAYRPDTERLVEYVFALEETLAPEEIRIELDAPETKLLDRLRSTPATVSTVPYRRGKGAAITAGFETLDTDVFAFADADGSTPPEELQRIIDPVTHRQTDLSVGSRRHPDATVTSHQTAGRRYLGDAFAWLARRLLDIKLYDYQCGGKAITSEGWEAVRQHLYAPGFAWDIELVAVADALELTVLETPIQWHDRPGSTVSPVRTTLSLARALLVVRHRANRLRNSKMNTAIADHHGQSQALIDRKRDASGRRETRRDTGK